MLALQNYAGSTSGSSSGSASSDNDSDIESKTAGTSSKTKTVDPEALAHLKPISVPEASVSRAICVQAAPDVVPIVR